MKSKQRSSASADASQSYLIFVGVILCFILSGFAALVYQTAWMRQFSLVFGTSELAVAAVLSAYMAGLALGANIASRIVDRITRPVFYYGVLEAGIAISALAVPLFLSLTGWLYAAMLGGQPNPPSSGGFFQSGFYLALAFLILVIPTAFMGATLPLLTKYAVRTKEQIGSRVGLLYAFNTAGAIGGTLVAGFILLPLLGLKGTVYVGVVINFLVFLIAAKIAKSSKEELAASKVVEAIEETQETTKEGVYNAKWILPIILFSGAISFIYEVLWTRLLGHVLGGSVIAFSTMLAGFLSGIAIGSAIASRYANSREQAMRLFVFCQIGIAITSILVYQALPSIVPEGTGGMSGNVLMALSVLLPSTLFIGATFPLAVRILASDERSAAPASAQVYSWNTVGAIVGATVAAFYIIPAFKYEGTIKLAVLGNLLLAAIVSLILTAKEKKQNEGVSSIARIAMGSALLIFVAVLVLYKPLMPEKVLRSSPVFASEAGEIVFYEVGRSATVIMVEGDNFIDLRTNGLPEAAAAVKGSPPTAHNQRMLSTMPVLVRPDIESMLIVGLGGGVALEGVPKSVDDVDVIELEPQVVIANRSISESRQWDPLSDPRINIIENDARSALALTDKKYGAIVSQPSHPWTAGASHLYTREFMQLADQHLNDDGVFLQWMNSQFVDEVLLRSLTATMLDVFPYVRMYRWDPEVLFLVGSRQSINPEVDLIRTGRPLNDDILDYFEKGVGGVEDLVAALAMDQENAQRFASGGQIITDNNNLMATRSARVMNTSQALRGSRLESLLANYDPILSADSEVRKSLNGLVDYAYVSRKLESKNLKARAIGLANSLLDTDRSQALQMIAVGQRAQGDFEETVKNLGLSLEADPQNQQARFILLEPWFPQYLQGRDLPEDVTKEFELLSGSAKSTLDAWLAIEAGDFRQAANLDPELAKALPSDIWYDLSVKLRVTWRQKVTTPELLTRFADEAVRLIDSAIVFDRSTDFYALRLQSTLVLQDQDKAMQTAAQLNSVNIDLINRVKNGLISSDSQLNSLLIQQRLVESALNGFLADSNVNQQRYASLLESNAASLDDLNNILNNR